MGNHSGILVFGEIEEGKPSTGSLELLGMGRQLADSLGQSLSIVFVRANDSACGQESIAFGADQVYLVDDAPIYDYEGASYASIMEVLCRDTVRPSAVLFSQNLVGRDLAPRLAFKLGSGLVMDCLWLGWEPESKHLLARRLVAGGNVEATYRVESDWPHLATIRPRAVAPLERDDSRNGEVLTVSAGVDSSAVKAKILDRVVEETSGPNLETAQIIVSGGRGISSPEDFEKYITYGLASVLGAAVGGTRAAVDSHLISEHQQVGLTGKFVSPNLYFAVALSGATQHMTGCQGAKHIVAINKDENAQIFAFAEFGIIADYRAILPLLEERLKEALHG